MTKQEKLEQVVELIMSGAMAAGLPTTLPTPWRMLQDGRWYRITRIVQDSADVEIMAEPPITITQSIAS